MKKSLEERLSHVQQWKESGLTQRAYCEQKKIKVGTFLTWLSLSKQDQSSDFIELKSPAIQISKLKLHYPNGVYLELPCDVSKEQLQNLIMLF